MREFIVNIGGSILAFVAIMAIALIPIYFIENSACRSKSVSFEGHDYGLIQGCMVKHKGRWLPLENIRGFDDRD